MRPWLPACVMILAGCATSGARSEPPESEVTIVPVEPPAPAAPPPTPLRLVAVGDIMLGSTYPYPDGRDLPPPDARPAGIMTPFAPLLQGADIAFGNLDGVIVARDDVSAAPKCDGLQKHCFAFRMPPELAPQLAAAGFDVLSMANNHVLDFGERGRDATRAQLDALGIAYSGRRGDIARMTVAGHRVSLIAFSNYDHSYDLNDLADATAVIAAEAARCEILVVSFHGGAEGPDRMHVPVGPEYFLGRNRGDLRVFARAAVDAGADLVLGHGPHVVRAMELYRERLIAYSLGNFATYKRFNLEGPNGQAIALEVALDAEGRFVSGQVHPLRQLFPGGPEPDPDAAALASLRTLSREDFPETGVAIGEGGAIAPRVASGVPAPAPPGARHLAELHPQLEALALELYRRALAAGIPFRVVFGYTPYTPRSRPGPGGMATWHQFGLAFDVLIADRRDLGDGRAHFREDDAAWKKLGAIAEELGLVWGGIWRSYDPFHFEWHPGDDSTISSSDLTKLLALAGPRGKEVRAVWSLYASR